jgi:hypothetical protein
MKWVVTFGLSSIYICSGQNKPFNPLLGETNQGSFGDGTKFYCEHTSHHPPISHYLLENENYTLSGYYEFIGKMGGNSLTSGLRGPSTLVFKDGTKIIFNAPDFKLGGTMIGERTIECVGSLVFNDVTNKIKAVVMVNNYKEGGFFGGAASGSKTGLEGVIYEVAAKDNNTTKFGSKQNLPECLKDVKDIKKKLSSVSGSWINQIKFDDKVYWDIDQVSPMRQIPQTKCQE